MFCQHFKLKYRHHVFKLNSYTKTHSLDILLRFNKQRTKFSRFGIMDRAAPTRAQPAASSLTASQWCCNGHVIF